MWPPLFALAAAAGAGVMAVVTYHHPAPAPDPAAPVEIVPIPAAAPVAYRTVAPPVVPVSKPSRIPPLRGGAGLVDNAVALVRYIQATYPNVASIGGVRPDPIPDHPSGRAIDVMVGRDADLGNRVLADVLAQSKRFGVRYAIWRETLHRPNGTAYWMRDRGNPTLNHLDHVHITVVG